MRPMLIREKDFAEEVLKAAELTIAYFEVPWRRFHRRFMTPILEVISDRYDWEVKIVRMDMEECAHTAKEYGVKNIPTLLYFLGGKIIDRQEGHVSIQSLDARIQRLLSVTV